MMAALKEEELDASSPQRKGKQFYTARGPREVAFLRQRNHLPSQTSLIKHWAVEIFLREMRRMIGELVEDKEDDTEQESIKTAKPKKERE